MARLFSMLAQPMFDLLGPERSHAMAIQALKSGLYPRARNNNHRLEIEVFGLKFPNPLGIAAGFDKNAEVPDAILNMGLGFAEIGTVTPKPQRGNPRPRVFRLADEHAVINRLGFNNQGHDVVCGRLMQRAHRPGIVGVNIGVNKDSPDRIADFIVGIRGFYDLASYFVINISSPNTPGLRNFQTKKNLTQLMKRVLAERAMLIQEQGRTIPILFKISPDLADEDLADIAKICLKQKIDGVIISNTTITRENVSGARAKEQGGLSGSPLFALSTAKLAQFYLLTKGKIPLIGVGGIDSPETAYAKIKAGASLLQLYTGLIYQGFDLIGEIKHGLVAQLEADGHKTITEAVGKDAKNLAKL